jgi:hypothetical protein
LGYFSLFWYAVSRKIWQPCGRASLDNVLCMNVCEFGKYFVPQISMAFSQPEVLN